MLLKRHYALLPLALAVLSSYSVQAAPQPSLTPATQPSAEEELAYTLGVQAMLYGAGPLAISMVRQTSTATDTPLSNGMAPMNQMGKTYRLMGPDDKLVPTVNNDTLYSQSQINLDQTGPLVIEIPKTNDRYFIVQLLDSYSEAIDNLIASNVGNQGSKVLLVKRGWQGKKPKGIDRVIESRTPNVWYIQRTAVAGESDLAAAKEVHAQFVNYPLSELGQAHPAVKQTPTDKGMPAPKLPTGLDWYAAIDTEMRHNPLPEDKAMVEQFKYIGIGGEKPFDASRLTEAQKRGLLRALESSQNIVKWASRTVGTKNNGWSMMYEGGRYGSDYLSRATINYRALGLNTPERALYPNRYTDANNQQLNGKNDYRMTMPASPPANAFWSLTMYDAKHLFMVENPIDRYSISSLRKDELHYNQDGSLTVCVQHDKPTDAQCNWLPAPKGDFYLHMRLYEPSQAVLNNQYPLPQVIKQ
ncbi:DUF1254 domain-containing protein [Vibrio vulnificus]|uniref:DUF1254 domain-containing protein n=1 Tax=Vibrio vulnificus TaxID=672 RepID=UPI0012ADEEFE|nr:DUF1214 domain-containing protein [Vibrio vulnificus]EGR0231025.1 DUF1254 domain-containing protein [Vibrio vulnificus]EJV9421422.1 DUF1254 domain-containing protein [Vibrio vulnificus]ELK2035947.1 DUF1254 domain-containing protein [Vibrio vulnificus]ELK2281726.1 DUF1254 domain-containing protein [Vibrio vulnificus]MCA3936758.1 DUF1254 domain-containing protein [Vibrio vulnificus]